jgi:RNA polymerase sigma-70 factor (ECF subfamily)
MDDVEPIPVLVQQLRGGNHAAAEKLFRRYAQRLTHLAEQHLSHKLAGRLDGEDVVQSVFRTFFRRSAQGEFTIDSSAQLWRLLVTITLRKVRYQARYHGAGMRDAGAEVHPGSEDWLPEAVAHEPDPAEAAALVDEVEALLCGLPPLYAQLLELRLQGYDSTELVTRLGVSRVTIHRMLSLLRQRLTAAAAKD